jgi:hypothetical protein
MSDDPSKSKIHVDSDWKAEAEAAKETLAAEEKADGGKHQQQLPDPTLADLINTIAMPAAMALGGYKTPDGKVMPPDLGAAKFHIDLLALLEEKTRGNVTDEESRQISHIVHQLRMQFTTMVTEIGKAAAPAEEK